MADPCEFSATASSRRDSQRPAWQGRRRLLLLSALLVAWLGPQHASTQSLGHAVTSVDIDLATGAISVSGPDPNTPASPGSTLKPIVLLTALQLGVITSHTRVACIGSLHIAGRNLACAHPVSLGVLDAEEALAYSCNTYFARVAQQLPPSALQDGLEHFGIRTEGLVSAPDQRVLLALGLERVTLTPLQLAHAYARLAQALERRDPPSEIVRAGLLGSVAYGMAHAAQTLGLTLGGKTGTAHEPAPMLQHGWFAGLVFASAASRRSTHVLVVYAPGGNGNDAASAAHAYLQSRHW